MDFPTDIELVERAKVDADAFATLYRKYVQRVWQFVSFRITDTAEAEDVTALVWEKVLKSLSKFNPKHEASFAAWLFQIARHAITDSYREADKCATVDLDATPDLIDERTDAPEVAAQIQLRAHLSEQIRKLPAQQAQIIELRFFAELKNKEIAVLLRINEQSVSSALCRGLKKLQVLLPAGSI